MTPCSQPSCSPRASCSVLSSAARSEALWLFYSSFTVNPVTPVKQRWMQNGLSKRLPNPHEPRQTRRLALLIRGSQVRILPGAPRKVADLQVGSFTGEPTLGVNLTLPNLYG